MIDRPKPVHISELKVGDVVYCKCGACFETLTITGIYGTVCDPQVTTTGVDLTSGDYLELVRGASKSLKQRIKELKA